MGLQRFFTQYTGKANKLASFHKYRSNEKFCYSKYESFI